MKTHRSALILTHHKAASTFLRRVLTSTFLSNYIVKDYAGEYWSAPISSRIWSDIYEKLNESPDSYFKENGYLYGPLRSHVAIEVKKFKRIIIARDPLETLVSQYVSFGFTHPEPKGGLSQSEFLRRRYEIQEMGLDDYVEVSFPGLLKRFDELADAALGESLILPYKSISEKPQQAIKKFNNYLGIIQPAWLTYALVRARQNHKQSKIHRSRSRDYPNTQVSDEKYILINNAFSDYKFLWDSEL